MPIIKIAPIQSGFWPILERETEAHTIQKHSTVQFKNIQKHSYTHTKTHTFIQTNTTRNNHKNTLIHCPASILL
jgi:hypothetical protein